ncbi:uncharacterized protein LOC141856528 [Brevipalpus obovatus]|uniref:uncharacterized protein LOC141856528 n=1 Tax=Brevipalpus obovatus TaxID=246614 RepID=UPI003D9F9933
MVDLASNSSDSSPESSPTSTIDSGSNTPSTGSNYSPISSPVFARRDHRRLNTKERLFGPPEETHRRIRDTLRSSVFSPQPIDNSPPRAAKKVIHTIRRNPITGHVYENVSDGRSLISHDVIRATEGRSLSLPTTPIRSRHPPGGKSSGIFC